MHCSEVAIPAEIRYVQCEYMAYAVDIHRSRQPRIVNLNPQDAVLNDDFPPFSINRVTIRQKNHAGFDCAYFSLCVSSGQT